MPRRKNPEDLSVEELRRLLIEKRRGVRRERLEHFRRTGRVVSDVEPPQSIEAVDEPHTGPVVDTSDLAEADESPRKKRRGFGDRLLLAVEILAVVGLVGVLLNGFGLLRSLNREVAAALNPETPMPTPLVMAVVLPSGHTPPDEQGNTRPNEVRDPGAPAPDGAVAGQHPGAHARPRPDCTHADPALERGCASGAR